MKELAAIIVAAGKSQRMGGVDKQMRTVAGVPVLARTIEAFEACEDVGGVVLVLNPDNMSAAQAMGTPATVRICLSTPPMRWLFPAATMMAASSFMRLK